jgi:fused signal recognition particle receptor
MFGFFRRKPPAPIVPVEVAVDLPAEVAVDVAAQALEQAELAKTSVIAPAPAPALPPPAPAPLTPPLTPPPPLSQTSALFAQPSIALQEKTSLSWTQKLKQGLAKTRGNLAGLFSRTKIDEDLYEALETALIASDTGYATTEFVLSELKEVVRRQRLESGDQVRHALALILTDLLKPLEAQMDIDRAKPLVLMMTGVNGAGKTTSIGKLTHHLRTEHKSILLAAADTFRAAAREQLLTWGERNQVQVISQEGGDPAAVAFDAVSAGIARGTDVILVDTAGRLPTQAHLMEELKKIRRVVAKALPQAPHEVVLVLDGNTGQNMLAQVKAFDEAVQLTGLIVTKLDGTAKGGALAALAFSFRQAQRAAIPVYFIGVGEGLDDLQSFSSAEFAQALFN